METILTAIFAFFGGSVASGLTWDFMKSKGTGLIDSFKKRFVNKKDFSNNSDAEEFLKYISESKVTNKDEAEKNAKSWYEKRTGQQDSQEFIKELVDWIKENQKQFSDLSMTNVQVGVINTGTQTITGNVAANNTTVHGNQINNNTTNNHGNTKNIETQNNYGNTINNNYGNPSNDPQDEKKNS